MKLWPLLLLLPSFAWGVDLELCDHVNSVNNKYTDGFCPPDLSNGLSGANLESDGSDGQVTTDKTTGTIYACVTTSQTPPSAADIIADTGCDGTGPFTATVSGAGTYGFDDGNSNRFTGLSDSTKYWVHYHHAGVTNQENRPNEDIETTQDFTTLAGGGAGGGDLTGTVFIADSNVVGGSDTGLDLANAWDTISDVNNQVTTNGADVCLMDDSVFEDEQLWVDWTGEVTATTVTDTTISFTAPDTISDSGSGFGSFAAGDEIRIEGSSDTNDGLYLVDTAAAGTITTVEQTVLTEAATPSITITKHDRVNIGTCYVDTGDSNKLRWYEHGTGTGRGEKAEINGTFDSACRSQGFPTCDPSEGGDDVPDYDLNQGLARLQSVSYVTVKNLKIEDSAGRGLDFAGTSDHNHIFDNDFRDIYDSLFFHAGFDAHYTILRNNTMHRGGYVYARNLGWERNLEIGGACWQLSQNSHEDNADPAYAIAEGNEILDCSGEGLTALRVSHSIIRGNYCLNCRNVGMYLDMTARSVWEWNIIAELSDNTTISQGSTGGSFFQVENNGARDGDNNVVRHNLQLHTDSGMGASIEGPQQGVRFVGKYAINNTIWDVTDYGWSESFGAAEHWEANSEVTNNVFIGDGGATCRTGPPTYNYNAWDETQAGLGDNCEGANDEYEASPTFSAPDATPPTYANKPVFSDYEITGGEGDASGLDLSADPLSSMMDANCAEFPQLEMVTSTTLAPFTPECTKWRAKSGYDNDGSDRSATPDMGAF